MENNIYNAAGRYITSKKEFKKYIKTELIFYSSLHKSAIENGQYNPRVNKPKRKISNLNENLD